jgi:two-component sensor histidine kinase
VTPETAQLIRSREDRVGIFDGSWHATPNNVARSRRALLASLREAELSAEILDSIGVAVTEVTTNTVYHAYVGRRIGQFRMTATIRRHEVNVSVEDDGCGFDSEADRPAGGGLALVASVAAHVVTSSRQEGTVTAMCFERPRGSRQPQ